jgi:hypothetical protein
MAEEMLDRSRCQHHPTERIVGHSENGRNGGLVRAMPFLLLNPHRTTKRPRESDLGGSLLVGIWYQVSRHSKPLLLTANRGFVLGFVGKCILKSFRRAAPKRHGSTVLGPGHFSSFGRARGRKPTRVELMLSRPSFQRLFGGLHAEVLSSRMACPLTE